MKNRMLLISLLAVAALACGIPFQAERKAMDRRQELPESGLQKKATTT